MQKKNEAKDLRDTISIIIEAIRTKKGNKIIDLNINKFSSTVCRHFVICDAQSHVQVKSIADEIEDQLLISMEKKAYHKEGYQNGYWVLLDFADVVVHVFQTEARQFYNLEGLWGDGIFKRYNS